MEYWSPCVFGVRFSEAHENAAQRDEIPFFHFNLEVRADRVAVDLGAVLASHVLNEDTALREEEFGVFSRDGLLDDLEIVIRTSFRQRWSRLSPRRYHPQSGR